MGVTIKVYQGDSFGKDYYSPDVPDFSQGWEGDWCISTALDDPEPLHEGPLTVSEDFTAMQCRISPTVNGALEVGNYILTVEVRNPDMDFVKEIEHAKYVIMVQGFR